MMNRALALTTLLCLSFTGCAGQSPTGTGTYSTAAVADQDVQAAAAFAVKEQQAIAPVKLIRIVRAEKQVVAGMNYRLTLEVEIKGERKMAEAVVWWQSWRTPAYQLKHFKIG